MTTILCLSGDERILGEAKNLFFSKGYHETTMDEVALEAAEAGLGRDSVWD
ncbi:MAG: TetR family transcriptional regulator [Deltaproteobacteria bacterium]|nr:TetR family transcriptional regulator [Deltaproteobacteria bacterium]